MNKFQLLIFSIFALAVLSACSEQHNNVKVLSNIEHEGYNEQSEPAWYMLSEYHPMRTMILGECEKWVGECLKDFEFIKPGAIRQEVMRKFPMDGGLSSPSCVRFVHPECSFFKVDVSFMFERDSADQGRAIMGKDDKVTEVSKPYIEYPIMD